MADQGITLNIYDKPPQINDNTNDTIYNNETGLNLNTNRLPEYPSTLDNIRDNTRNNINSAPRANYGRSTLEGTGTTESSIDSTRNPNNIQSPIPIQPYPIIYQQPQINQVPVTPVVSPIQYNPQYGQPVIMQQGNIIQQKNNQQPETVIIQENEVKKKDNTSDCCAGFLAGLASCCAICCLLMLCSGGGGGSGRRGRRGWWFLIWYNFNIKIYILFYYTLINNNFYF